MPAPLKCLIIHTVHKSALTNLDIDLHMPFDINFGYYDSHEFHSNQDDIKCFRSTDSFSAIHCNVRSLSANLDKFINMLSELHFSFSLIGLSETKLKFNKDRIFNLQIPNPWNSFFPASYRATYQNN